MTSQNQDHGRGVVLASDLPEQLTREQLISRVTNSFGPAADGGQLATNTALAQRIVAALIALGVIRDPTYAPARSTEQDQPKKKDPVT